MSIIVLETCRGVYCIKEFVHQVGKKTIIVLGCTANKIFKKNFKNSQVSCRSTNKIFVSIFVLAMRHSLCSTVFVHSLYDWGSSIVRNGSNGEVKCSASLTRDRWINILPPSPQTALCLYTVSIFNAIPFQMLHTLHACFSVQTSYGYNGALGLQEVKVIGSEIRLWDD